MIRAIDCFCGAGGLSCGLASASVDVVLGIDVDAQALKVYRRNHSHRAQTIDLSDTSRAADARDATRYAPSGRSTCLQVRRPVKTLAVVGTE